MFYERLLRELEGDPQFEAAALTNRFRMVFSGNGPVEIEGKEYRENRDRPNANFEQVSGGFFAVTGQKLIEGRTFTSEDRAPGSAPTRWPSIRVVVTTPTIVRHGPGCRPLPATVRNRRPRGLSVP